MPDPGAIPGVNWKQVTPAERARLQGLINHYRGKPHPFTACVRDNTKRFGPDRAKRICAVLKDLIEGGTGWRGKDRKMEEIRLLNREEIAAVVEMAEALLDPDDLARAYAYNPGQARAPKGTVIGGRWIALLARAESQRKRPGGDHIGVHDAASKETAKALVARGDLKQISPSAVEITPKGERTLRDAVKDLRKAKSSGATSPKAEPRASGATRGEKAIATEQNILKVSKAKGSGGRGLGGDRSPVPSSRMPERPSGDLAAARRTFKPGDTIVSHAHSGRSFVVDEVRDDGYVVIGPRGKILVKFDDVDPLASRRSK